MNRLLACLLLGLTLPPVWANEVGQLLPTFTLDDAHGNEQQLDDSVQRIYANGDRSGGKLIKASMEPRGQAALDAQNAIVIGEISAAPGFVKRIIRSGLKDRNYRTWVDERGKTKKFLPYRPDRISVIDLSQRKIIAIQYVADEEALGRLLDEQLAKSSPAASPVPSPQPSAPAPVADSN